MSDLRYVVSGDIYRNKNYSFMRGIIFQQQMLIEEVIDIMQDSGYSLSPYVKYIYDLCLSREEVDLIMNCVRSDDALSVKIKWLANWMEKNIYEQPKEYIMQMIEDLNHVTTIALPKERTEIKMDDKKLEKELRTICFQQDCVLNDLLNMVRNIEPQYVSEGSVIFELRLTEENRSDIEHYMSYHVNDTTQSKKEWLEEYLNKRNIEYSNISLEQVLQAFSTDYKVDYVSIKEILQIEE